jgi:hypothetical protein
MQVLQATVHLVLLDQDKSSVFNVKDVVVKVHTPSATRNTTFSTKSLNCSLLVSSSKKAIKAEGLITTGTVYVGGQLVGVRDRMANAKVTEGKSRSKVLRICRVHYGPQFYAYI